MRRSEFVLYTNLCFPFLLFSLEQSTRQVRALEELYLRLMQWLWHNRGHWTLISISITSVFAWPLAVILW